MPVPVVSHVWLTKSTKFGVLEFAARLFRIVRFGSVFDLATRHQAGLLRAARRTPSASKSLV